MDSGERSLAAVPGPIGIDDETHPRTYRDIGVDIENVASDYAPPNEQKVVGLS